MLSVFAENDRVIIDLCGRRRDVLLKCDAALRLAETLDARADDAAQGPASVFHGEQWGCRVESYDGTVALRFSPPSVGNPERVPLPAAAARQLAGVIRDKESWARHRMRLVVQGA